MARYAPALLVAGLLGATLGTAQAQAPAGQGIEFSCPAAGTRVKLDISSTEMVFKDRTDWSCRYQQGSGEYRLFSGMYFRAPETWNEFGQKQSEAMKAIWPLRSGNTSEFTVNGNSTDGFLGLWKFTYSVGNHQTVETPAGKFDTIVISLEEKGMMRNIFHSVKRYYYAPKEAMVVKFEVDFITGYNKDVKSWQLAEYHPA